MESKKRHNSVTLFWNLFAQIIAQFPADGWVAQAAQCLCFDLADTLAGDAHFAAHFLESVCLSVEQAVT